MSLTNHVEASAKKTLSDFVEDIKQDAKFAQIFSMCVYVERQFLCFYVISALATDCAAGQFRFPGPDVHSDCSALRRVSQSDPQSLDVRTAVHFL